MLTPFKRNVFWLQTFERFVRGTMQPHVVVYLLIKQVRVGSGRWRCSWWAVTLCLLRSSTQSPSTSATSAASPRYRLSARPCRCLSHSLTCHQRTAHLCRCPRNILLLLCCSVSVVADTIVVSLWWVSNPMFHRAPSTTAICITCTLSNSDTWAWLPTVLASEVSDRSCLSVRLFVCLQNIWNQLEPITFISACVWVVTRGHSSPETERRGHGSLSLDRGYDTIRYEMLF